jgi:hypothetical protein
MLNEVKHLFAFTMKCFAALTMTKRDVKIFYSSTSSSSRSDNTRDAPSSPMEMP